MPYHPRRFTHIFTVSALFATLTLATGNTLAASCKEVTSQSACEKRADCTWVKGYKRKDGAKVKAYCRAKGTKKKATKKTSQRKPETVQKKGNK